MLLSLANRHRGLLLEWLALSLLALAFLGARPIWDPDEGRYTNVALNMLDSGDWIHPMRSHEVAHWTKPPLAYWAIAGSLATFGRSAWAARLPVALSFLLCAWVCGRIARRIAPGAETAARLAFASMALPLLAAQLVTTDFLLAALESVAMWMYVEARFGARERRAWAIRVLWLSLGLAFLTKGPPALLPLPAILAFERFSARPDRSDLWRVDAVALFLVPAIAWFARVTWETPLLAGHFLGTEVVRRIAGDGFARNSNWYGWLIVYVPTLMLGALPWTPRLLRWLHVSIAQSRPWRRPGDADTAPRLLLLLWLVLPLLVLCLARSRLPLYLLPLFVPVALAVAQQSPRLLHGATQLAGLVLWITGIVLLRLAAAHWPTHKDAGAWAAALRARTNAPVTEVVFVDDMARYGLHLELGAEVEKVTTGACDTTVIDGPCDHTLLHELHEPEPGRIFVARPAAYFRAAQLGEGLGARITMLGDPYQGRIVFQVEMPTVGEGSTAAAGAAATE